MLRLIFSVCFIAAASAYECENLLSPVTLECCNVSLIPPDMNNQVKKFEECLLLMLKTPTECEVDICIGQKLGYGTENGTLIRSGALEDLGKGYGFSADVLESVKNKCILGDLNNYGNPDTCELVKYRHCIELQILKNETSDSQQHRFKIIVRMEDKKRTQCDDKFNFPPTKLAGFILQANMNFVSGQETTAQ